MATDVRAILPPPLFPIGFSVLLRTNQGYLHVYTSIIFYDITLEVSVRIDVLVYFNLFVLLFGT